MAEGYTDQQFAANVDEAQHRALSPMRQRMDPPALSHLLKQVGRERQPFGVDAEEQCGGFGRPQGLPSLREMLGPCPTIFRQQWTIEKLNSSLGENRTVAATDEPLQLRATGVALHTDFTPACPDVEPLVLDFGL